MPGKEDHRGRKNGKYSQIYVIDKSTNSPHFLLIANLVDHWSGK